MSRKEARASIERMQNKGFYNEIEYMPERKIWFAVVHNEIYRDDKGNIKRLLRGEKWMGKNGRNVKMVYGYGKLLGIVHLPATRTTKAFNQYVIYDVVILVGEERKYSYNVYHEGWIKLGNWVRDSFPYLTKEKVIFT